MTEDLEYQELIKADAMDRMSDLHGYCQLTFYEPMPLKLGPYDLIFEDTPLESGSVFGLIFEAAMIKSGATEKATITREANNKSPYDFTIETENYIMLINLKVRRRRRNGKDAGESGIAAYSNLLNCLEKHNKDKPVFYYVYTIEYDLDHIKEEVVFLSFDYYCLNNVLMEPVRTDGRKWSTKSKKITGRIMLHAGNSRLKNIVPTFNEFTLRLEQLRRLESDLKLPKDYFYGRACDPNIKILI